MRVVLPKNAKLVPKDAELVFKGVIHDIYQWQQEMFDGTYKTFEMLKRPDTVKIVAVRDGKLVVLRQQQPNTGIFYDLPGGRHDNEAETELEAAQRELLEETGMKFKTWKLLSAEQVKPNVEQVVYTYLATDFESQGDQQLDAGERIEVEYMSLEDARALSHDSEYRFIPTVILEENLTIEKLYELPAYTDN